MAVGAERAGQDTPLAASTGSQQTSDHVIQQALGLLDKQTCVSRVAQAAEDRHLKFDDIRTLLQQCAATTSPDAKKLPPAVPPNPETPHRDVTDRTPQTGASRQPGDVAPAPHLEPAAEKTARVSEPAFAPTRERLISLAQEKYKDDPKALADFNHDMADFEKRMMPASPVEVQRTYTQLSRILAGPSTVVSDGDRVKLAQQVLHEAAHPEGNISQGISETCGSASLESKAYTESPGSAAKLVADIALTGSYRTPEGRTISPTTGISHPYVNDGMDRPGRTFASQIFQVTAMNTYVDMLNQSQHPPGHYRYALTPTNVKGAPFEEHIFDDSKHPPKDTGLLGLPFDENTMTRLYRSLTNTSEVITPLTGTNVHSLQEFKDKLTEALKNGKFPLVLVVYPSDELVTKEIEDFKKTPDYEAFRKQFGDIDLTLSFGYHAITAQGYDPKTGKVTYQDPTLSHTPHETDPARLAQAMGVTLYPEADDKYYDFQRPIAKDDQFKPQTNYQFLAQLPLRERQDEFTKLCQNRTLYADDFTDDQLRTLSLTRPPS